MNIVIVGATSAVAQSAIRIWAAGQHSFVLYGRNASELEKIAADARVRGAIEVTVHAGDIASVTYAQTAVANLSTTHIALIAHGSLTLSDRADTDTDYMASEINVNFTSAAAWAQLLANHMATHGGGSVAVISSVAGDRGRYSNHAYGAAKAGLSAYCSGLRARMWRRGVHVLTVKPGFIDTPMMAHVTKKGVLWATPEAIAQGIIRGIERKRNVVYLPKFWALILLAVKHVPESIFKRLKF
ncbi:MAG: SDR family NAD(P)-dependent oxidoreductase [Betaproteobacteria bacterium]|nr:MAG: SDR family NAD(P)-dependent oxidoreductase [Betaproteobacteria bacterium]